MTTRSKVAGRTTKLSPGLLSQILTLRTQGKSVSKVCRLLGFSRWTYYRWIRRGKADAANSGMTAGEKISDSSYARLYLWKNAAPQVTHDVEPEPTPAATGLLGWWEGGDFDWQTKHAGIYLMYAHPDTLESYKERGIAPPPRGLNFSHWPPKKPKDLIRAIETYHTAIAEKGIDPDSALHPDNFDPEHGWEPISDTISRHVEERLGNPQAQAQGWLDDHEQARQDEFPGIGSSHK